MPKCEVCGNSVGIMSMTSENVTVGGKYLYPTLCPTCRKHILNRYSKESYEYLTSLLERTRNDDIKLYLNHWVSDVKAAQQHARVAKEAQLEQEDALRKETQRENASLLNKLKNSGSDGYYEYKVIKLMDNVVAGCLDADVLMATLNNLGLEGWRLVTAYTNELGKNSNSYNGYGSNATADEHILIFERFQKIQ